MDTFTQNDQEFADRLDQVLSDIRKTLIAKHHDYGSSNLLKRGELGLIVRIEDKLSRAETLLDKDPAVIGESRNECWRDICGYALQALIQFGNTPAVKSETVDDFARKLEESLSKYGRFLCPVCGKAPIEVSGFDRLGCCACGTWINLDIAGLGNNSDPREDIRLLASRFWQKSHEKAHRI